jgi:hypothetical protein
MQRANSLKYGETFTKTDNGIHIFSKFPGLNQNENSLSKNSFNRGVTHVEKCSIYSITCPYPDENT